MFIISDFTMVVYENERILLTGQLADSYGTDDKRISENYNRNKSRYKEKKHYHLLQGEDLKAFKKANPQFAEHLKFTSSVYVWTKKGAWLHAKSLNTDQAWEAYEALVDDYYDKLELIHSFTLPQNYKEALVALVGQVEQNEVLLLQNTELEQVIAENVPLLEEHKKFLDTENFQSLNIISKMIGLGRSTLCEFLRWMDVFTLENIPTARYTPKDPKKAYFKVTEKTVNMSGDDDNPIYVNKDITSVSARGSVLINKLYKENCIEYNLHLQELKDNGLSLKGNKRKKIRKIKLNKEDIKDETPLIH